MGRPSDYSTEVSLTICERIAEGESLRAICQTEEMPNRATVFRWLEAHEAFRDQYTRARDMQADALADELIDIADDSSNDWMDRQMKDGGTDRVVDSETINRSRLRIDARKWIASKLKPKKYGDKLDLEHSGKNGGPIVISSIDAEL